jgi:hypothetical protein
MEISGLVSADTLFELDVEHPTTGKPVGIKVMLRSAGSEDAMKVVRRQTDAILARQQKRKAMTAEMIEEHEIDQAVSYVASWDWGDNTYDGKKPGSDAASIKAILQKEPWLYAAIANGARDIANFTKS